MNNLNNSALLNKFVNHTKVDIVAISKKSPALSEKEAKLGSNIFHVKKIDLTTLPAEKFLKYHKEKRIAFILDNQALQLDQCHFDKETGHVVCHIKNKPAVKENFTEDLSDLSVESLSSEEYDAILQACQEILETAQRKNDFQTKEDTKKHSYRYMHASEHIRIAIKSLLLKNLLRQMSDITMQLIHQMEEAREEDRIRQKADRKKIEEKQNTIFRQRRVKEDLKAEDVSKEKQERLKSQSNSIISEHIA